ncbi:MAG: hypothetical protein U1E76_07190 [Planctomycetota bacterium]
MPRVALLQGVKGPRNRAIRPMKQVSVTELKNRLDFLRLVMRGRGGGDRAAFRFPVARLSGVGQGRGSGQALLQRLVRDGIVVAASERPSREQMKKPPIACRGDVVRALIEERDCR